MKRLLKLTAAYAILATAAFAEERSVNLSVPGMFCASCPFVVQAAIQEVDGVVSVFADAEQRTALVIYDDAVASLEAIIAASTNAGYEATVFDGNS
ncbi:cation transporter [Aliiroseovarius subalbicans]|uniref:cation transporter n=1 Tax=Aliiroseovarius subalbicans TaxID=2925840 RepID=UPI001F5A933E|nr:cation transporter [Aliiroseovarius subalbicans]MCI2400976.1 cation transporter [Aliiroseovarius subalbicans]